MAANKNLEIYEKVRAVPKEAQKEFDTGSFKGTDINPMWRIKTLTEHFGMCGVGWYYEVLNMRTCEHGEEVAVFVDINLYVKVDGEWSKPIFGTGGNKVVKKFKSFTKFDDEGWKMAVTDAISVSAKQLGIGADIYFDKDSTKYTDNSETGTPKPQSQSNKTDSNKKDDKDMPDYKERLKDVFAELKRTGYTESHIKKHYKISHIKFMSNLQRDDFLAKIKNVPDKDENQEKIEGSSDEFMDASGADEIPFEDGVQFTEADEAELLDLFK